MGRAATLTTRRLGPGACTARLTFGVRPRRGTVRPGLSRPEIARSIRPASCLTVDEIRRVMNLVFKHGQTCGLIPRGDEANPMKFVTVRTQSEYEAMIITPEQGFKILTAMPQLERILSLLIAVRDRAFQNASVCSGPKLTTKASRFLSGVRGRVAG